MSRTSQRVGGAWDISWWPNLPICRITRCAVMPSFIWSSTCRHIMVGLLSVIDCLSFFLSFLSWQLKCTIVLSLLFVWVWHRLSDLSALDVALMCDTRPRHEFSRPRGFGLAWLPDPRRLGLQGHQTQRSWLWHALQT